MIRLTCNLFTKNKETKNKLNLDKFVKNCTSCLFNYYNFKNKIIAKYKQLINAKYKQLINALTTFESFQMKNQFFHKEKIESFEFYIVVRDIVR